MKDRGDKARLSGIDRGDSGSNSPFVSRRHCDYFRTLASSAVSSQKEPDHRQSRKVLFE
jgi:hypothetical protein